MSAQQNAGDILGQIGAYLSQNVFSYPLLGIVLFVGLLWFFHEFREWRLSVSVLTSLTITIVLMLVITSPAIHLLGL